MKRYKRRGSTTGGSHIRVARSRFSRTDAVSPVIGVVLMVVVTVLLAAIFASFVFSLSDRVDSAAPTASFGTEYDAAGASYPAADGKLQFIHEDGETIAAGNLHIMETVDGNSDGTWAQISGRDASDSVGLGDEITVEVASDDTVFLVYDDGTVNTLLYTWEGPMA